MSFLTSIPINNIDKSKKEKKKLKNINNNKNNNNLIKTNSIHNNLKKIEEKYLSYIIKSDTKFIDINKIENKFKNIVIDKYNKFNSNKIKIQNLKKEYNLILNEIQKELLNNYSIYNKILLNFFDKSIKKYTNLIKIKEHESFCYKNVYNRLRYSNYSIKKRIESELQNESIQMKQYSEYTMLKNLVLNSFNTHHKTLKNMKNYEIIKKEEYEEDLIKKFNKINNLEFQINSIKEAINYEEKNLLKENIKKNKIKNKILNEKKKNNIIIKDIIWIGNYYFKIKITVLKILESTKIKDINLLITKFNNIKQKYQNLSSKFIFYNLEIKRLKTLLTKYNDSLKQLLKKNKTKSNKINLENYEIKEKTEINSLKFQNKIINDNFHKSLFLIQRNINFMEESLLNFNKIDINYGKYSYKMNINLIKLNLDNKKSLKKIFLNIIKLFFKFNYLFHNTFFHIYENCILNECDDDDNSNNNNKVYIKNIFNKEDFEIYKDKLKYFLRKRKITLKIINENNEKVLTNFKETIKNNDNNVFKKNNFSEKDLYNNFVNYLNNENNNNLDSNSKEKKISSNNINNIKIFNDSKSKNNLFNTKLNRSLSNSYGSTTISSNNKLLNNYNTFNHSFIFDHPRQIMRVLGKYQSSLIIKNSNKINYLKKLEKNKNYYDNVFNNSIKSLNIKNKEKITIDIKENSEKNFSNSNKLKHNYYLDNNEESDYSTEEKNLNIKTKIKLKKKVKINRYKFFRKEPEMNLIYKRSIDLKQLNSNYYDKKDKSLENSNNKFNELYYNFQKKNKKKKKNSCINVINKNINVKNKGVNRTFNKFLTTSLLINFSFKNSINKKRDLSFYNKNKLIRRRGGSTIQKNPQYIKKLLM